MKYIFPIASLVLDRVLKHKARSGQLPVSPCSRLEFRHIENDGLAGSTLRSHPKLVKALPCTALAVNIPTLLHGFRKQPKSARSGILLLLAGSASNVYDRLKNGTVTDMLRFPKALGRLKTLVFNVADFMILLGALLTLLTFSCPSKKKKI